MRWLRVLPCHRRSRSVLPRGAGAGLVLMTLTASLTAGFTHPRRGRSGVRRPGAGTSAGRADGLAVRDADGKRTEKKPRLEVPKAFYLAPAGKQGSDFRRAQGRLILGEKNLGKSDEEEVEHSKLTAAVSLHGEPEQSTAPLPFLAGGAAAAGMLVWTRRR